MAMAERRADVDWQGDLTKGGGQLTLTSSGVLTAQGVTWASRTERADGKTSPEELLAAAQASCYAMAFAHTLATAGTPPTRLHVAAVCSLDPKSGGGVQVTRMEIQVTGQVAGLDQAGFAAAARQAEQGCPIANAIRGNVAISVTATLEA